VSAPRACVCSSCPAHPAGVSAPPAADSTPSSSLTDAQWAIIEPLLPAPGNTAGRGGRPEKHSRRLVLDANFYLVRVYEGRDPQPTAASIDSQSVHGADTVPGATRGYDAGKRVNGCKRHIAVDTGGLLLAVIVTMAGLQDRDAAHGLLARLRERFTTIAWSGPMPDTPDGRWSGPATSCS
jgi:hypothetical protein